MVREPPALDDALDVEVTFGKFHGHTLGEIAAFRLTPRPLATPRGNITAEFWLAPSMQYLPVRVRVRLGEDAEVDLLVETIEQR